MSAQAQPSWMQTLAQIKLFCLSNLLKYKSGFLLVCRSWKLCQRWARSRHPVQVGVRAPQSAPPPPRAEAEGQKTT